MADPIFVQSISSLGGKPVAVSVRANSHVAQHIVITDVASDVGANVKSYAFGNPVLVALVDKTGAHLTVTSVAGTIQASVTGQLFTTASIAGTPAVSISGIPTFVGSTHATQGTSPWVTQAASTGHVQAVVGSVGATQLGPPWAVVGSASVTGSVGAIVTGSVTATQGAPPWTFTGSVGASQLGPWTFTGSAQVTQASSPWVTRPGSTGAVFSTVASVQGQVTATASIAGSVPVTQVTSPWIVQVASMPPINATTVESVFASQVGPWVFTGSVHATQATSPWVTQAGSSGATVLTVTSVQGTLPVTFTGATFTGSVAATQAGSWRVFLQGSDGTPLAVDSFGGGGLLRVAVYSGAGGVGTSQVSVWIGNTPSMAQGTVPWVVTGSVQATQQTSPWVTFVGSTGALFSTVTSLVGQPTVTASVVGTLPVTFSGLQSVTGSVGVTQQSSPWLSQLTSGGAFIGYVVASVPGAIPVTFSNATVTGSVGATQLGAPWSVVGSTAATQAGPWTFTGSVGVTQQSSPWLSQITSGGQFIGLVVASVPGSVPVTFTGATFTGSVGATQLGGAWSVIGSVSVTGSVGAIIVGSITGTVVASLPGQTTVTASVVGQPTVTASCVGQQFVTASCVGQQFVTASLVGAPSFVGSVRVSPFNTAFATAKIIVSTSGTLLPASNLANRGRLLLYNRGMPATPNSSSVVWLGAVGVNSSTGWPLEYGGTFPIEAGATMQFAGATVGSFGTPVNSGQEVAVFELA